MVVVLGPLMYLGLLRMHRQYGREEAQLEQGAQVAAEAPVLGRHVVAVLVDRLDLATARALQYARTLHPDELRAVHFCIDNREASALEAEWSRLGLSRLPLDVIECPDRRLTRATLELAAETVADGDTELSILLPRRGYAGGWNRLLHDRTADRIATTVGQLPHVNATVVPYQLSGGWLSRRRQWGRDRPGAPGRGLGERRPEPEREAGAGSSVAGGTDAIGAVEWRTRARVAGRVKSVRVQPRAGTANLECVLADDTGTLLLVFQGRRRVPGIQPGTRLVAAGMVGDWLRRQAMLNPDYEIVAGPDVDED